MVLGFTRRAPFLHGGKFNNWKRSNVSADNLRGEVNMQVYLFHLYEYLSVSLLNMGVGLNKASAKAMGMLPPTPVGLRFHSCRV